MPPGPSQKGTGKKNSAIQKQSRNTTPAPAVATASLPPTEFYDPDYLNTRVILFRNLTYDDIVDQSASNATIPDSKSLDGMIERLKNLSNIMEKRSTFYDRGMRHLADERKKRPSEDYGSRDGEQEGKRPKHKRKKPDSLAPQETNVGMFIRYAPQACAATGACQYTQLSTTVIFWVMLTFRRAFVAITRL